MKRVGWKTLLLPGALAALFGAAAGLLSGRWAEFHPAWTFLAGALLSGCVLLAVFLAGVCRPLVRLGEAVRRVLEGDLSARARVPGFPAGAQLRELTRDFNEVARRLEEDTSREWDVLPVFFHELKAPLATIGGYAQLLEKNLHPEQNREFAQIIRSEVEEMAGLADSLLLLSRLDAGRPEQPPETVDVAEQVRRAFTAREPRWREKELTLALSLGDAKARGYGPLLAHVWGNLVDNAVKYSPAGGTIMRQREGRVRFVIRNGGAPILPADLPRVFEPFYRAGNGGGESGHGVGLALARRIVALHGGEITVESGETEGTSFTVTL
ncbi:MAG: ATP-binding protein [Anaerotruncus massiliensis (ex Togo et al. 2019)]